MAEKSKAIGTSDMPLPQTIAYDNRYQVTDLFKKDLETILSDVAYVDAMKFFRVIDAHNSVFTAAILTEFLRSLTMLPYKVVSPLMKVLDDKDKFAKYFKQIWLVFRLFVCARCSVKKFLCSDHIAKRMLFLFDVFL